MNKATVDISLYEVCHRKKKGFVHERDVSGQSFTKQTSWPNNTWRMSLLHDQSAFDSCHVGFSTGSVCEHLLVFQGHMLFLDLLIGLDAYILAFWRAGFRISLTNFPTFASAKDVGCLSVVGLMCLGVIELMVENSKVNLTPFSFNVGRYFT